MVERTRVVVALSGVTLVAIGSGPGTVAVRCAGTDDWATATLMVDWNGSLSVAEGERRLETVGESVTLSEANESGETAVRLRVTAT